VDIRPAAQFPSAGGVSNHHQRLSDLGLSATGQAGAGSAPLLPPGRAADQYLFGSRRHDHLGPTPAAADFGSILRVGLHPDSRLLRGRSRHGRRWRRCEGIGHCKRRRHADAPRPGWGSRPHRSPARPAGARAQAEAPAATETAEAASATFGPSIRTIRGPKQGRLTTAQAPQALTRQPTRGGARQALSLHSYRRHPSLQSTTARHGPRSWR
jgi:hypothetical protein